MTAAITFAVVLGAYAVQADPAALTGRGPGRPIGGA